MIKYPSTSKIPTSCVRLLCPHENATSIFMRWTWPSITKVAIDEIIIIMISLREYIHDNIIVISSISLFNSSRRWYAKIPSQIVRSTEKLVECLHFVIRKGRHLHIGFVCAFVRHAANPVLNCEPRWCWDIFTICLPHGRRNNPVTNGKLSISKLT